MKLPTWSWRAGRPPRWFRISSAAIAVLFAVGLMNARELTDVIWGVLACSLMVLNAIAPKGLHDGRFTAWTQKHPIVTGGLTFLITGGGLVFLLSDHVAKWLAAVIALPLSAAFVAWMSYRERVATRETGRGRHAEFAGPRTDLARGPGAGGGGGGRTHGR